MKIDKLTKLENWSGEQHQEQILKIKRKKLRARRPTPLNEDQIDDVKLGVETGGCGNSSNDENVGPYA